ncbi:hypothetical protein COO60DRAFT_1478199 [Scenedesmus sp. NREL 46B-D3]|nr:hypothetical protein COO60DRAFT_1478199 [Scenedesmus sp. NREL 46B-D3]
MHVWARNCAPHHPSRSELFVSASSVVVRILQQSSRRAAYERRVNVVFVSKHAAAAGFASVVSQPWLGCTWRASCSCWYGVDLPGWPCTYRGKNSASLLYILRYAAWSLADTCVECDVRRSDNLFACSSFRDKHGLWTSAVANPSAAAAGHADDKEQQHGLSSAADLVAALSIRTELLAGLGCVAAWDSCTPCPLIAVSMCPDRGRPSQR